MYKIIFLIICFMEASPIFAQSKLNPYMKDFQKDVAKMMDFYSPAINFWQDKNCIRPGSCLGHEQGLWYWAQSALILASYQEQTGDKKYVNWLKNSYQKNWKYIINNNYYDDRLWWALALIKIYQVTKDKDALNKAQLLVTSVVKQGLQNVCHGSGGIYWNAAKKQVGSISNTLLITAAGRLYLITHDMQYKDIANKTWKWLQQSGLLDSEHNLADNYSVDAKQQCGKLATWHTTYNDGMLLGAVSTLELVNGQKELKQFANEIARKSLYEYQRGGIVEEVCTNAYACAEDGYMFKGIFVYNLALYAKYNQIDIKEQLVRNYSVLLNKQSGAEIYAFNWSLPVNFKRDDPYYNPADIVTFLSVLYLELANLILN